MWVPNTIITIAQEWQLFIATYFIVLTDWSQIDRSKSTMKTDLIVKKGIWIVIFQMQIAVIQLSKIAFII